MRFHIRTHVQEWLHLNCTGSHPRYAAVNSNSIFILFTTHLRHEEINSKEVKKLNMALRNRTKTNLARGFVTGSKRIELRLARLRRLV
jgi:hypothetical protein